MKVKELLGVIPNEEMIGFSVLLHIYDNTYFIPVMVDYAEVIGYKLHEDSYKDIYEKQVLGVNIVKGTKTYINIVI